MLDSACVCHRDLGQNNMAVGRLSNCDDQKSARDCAFGELTCANSASVASKKLLLFPSKSSKHSPSRHLQPRLDSSFPRLSSCRQPGSSLCISSRLLLFFLHSLANSLLHSLGVNKAYLSANIAAVLDPEVRLIQIPFTPCTSTLPLHCKTRHSDLDLD